MRKKIKIDFADLWGGFDKKDNYFYNLLIQKFDVEISNNPDYLFFSVFGQTHQNYNCKKIFYTGENVPPNFNNCDYAFSFDYIDDGRNYRLPHYLLYPNYYDLVNKQITNDMLDRKFCNFIQGNPNCPVRNNFFEKLSKYKKIDSGGPVMNNMGYIVTDKMSKTEWQSEYKFSFAFENEAYRFRHPGYTTEKIMQPMTVNSLPIYWGNPLVGKEFNTESFINYDEFKSEEDMIDYIIELDKNDDMYLKKLKNDWFVDNKIPEGNKEGNIKKYLYNIFL